MMLAPSASTSMRATVLGDTDMTVMRAYFVKPQAAIAMTFSDDPQMGFSPTASPVGHRHAGHPILRVADRVAALKVIAVKARRASERQITRQSIFREILRD